MQLSLARRFIDSFSFSQVEKSVPGFTQELLNGVVQKEAPGEDIDYTKSLLRMSKQDTEGSLDHVFYGFPTKYRSQIFYYKKVSTTR